MLFIDQISDDLEVNIVITEQVPELRTCLVCALLASGLSAYYGVFVVCVPMIGVCLPRACGAALLGV